MPTIIWSATNFLSILEIFISHVFGSNAYCFSSSFLKSLLNFFIHRLIALSFILYIVIFLTGLFQTHLLKLFSEIPFHKSPKQGRRGPSWHDSCFPLDIHVLLHPLSSQNCSSLNMHACFIPSWPCTSIFSPWKSPCYDSCQILNKQTKSYLKLNQLSIFLWNVPFPRPDINPFLRYSSTISMFVATCYNQILIVSLPLTFTYYIVIFFSSRY